MSEHMGICDACDALDLVQPEPWPLDPPNFIPLRLRPPLRKLCPKCWAAADNYEPSDRDMAEAADAALERSGDGLSEFERQRMRDAGRGNQVGR